MKMSVCNYASGIRLLDCSKFAPSLMVILSLHEGLTRNLEIRNTPVAQYLELGMCELGIPDLAQMSLIKCY